MSRTLGTSLYRQARRLLTDAVAREFFARGFARPGDRPDLGLELSCVFDQVNQPNTKRSKFLFLEGSLATNAGAWMSWQVPRNITWVYMACVGSGASGGGGQTSATGVVGGGGGGGGSGAFARLIIPAFCLPKTLYLSAGVGGAGVAAATAGSAGVRSFVSDKPFSGATAAADLVLVSGAAAAGGGATGAASAVGGTAETIATNVLQPYTAFGLWAAIAGMAGGASGASGSNGATVTWGASGVPVSGGTGGGTTNTSTTNGTGGPLTGAGLVPSLNGGAAAGGAGQPGWESCKLPPAMSSMNVSAYGQVFASTGGTGGGANQGTAGAGGKGGWGSGGGGGGGGGGTGGGTGGRSGDGGPGLIIIASW